MNSLTEGVNQRKPRILKSAWQRARSRTLCRHRECSQTLRVETDSRSPPFEGKPAIIRGSLRVTSTGTVTTCSKEKIRVCSQASNPSYSCEREQAPGSSTKGLSGKFLDFSLKNPTFYRFSDLKNPKLSSSGPKLPAAWPAPSKTQVRTGFWPFRASKNPKSDWETVKFGPQNPKISDKPLVELPGAYANGGCIYYRPGHTGKQRATVFSVHDQQRATLLTERPNTPPPPTEHAPPPPPKKKNRRPRSFSALVRRTAERRI
ncbi:hypothetical protein C8F01DRAFT_1088190 [Mycena amicta]|nr:hypothetical protein C8F01DRAFT_1088190 [Mycena amicta]